MRRLTGDEHRTLGIVSDAFAHASKRPQSMEAPGSDNDEIADPTDRRERLDRRVLVEADVCWRRG